MIDIRTPADELIGHFVNYRKQVSPSLKKLLPKEDFRLYAVSTRFPEKPGKEAVLTPADDGVYDIRWGIRDIRLIVTSQIAEEKRNAMWLMFSALRDRVRYGFSHYRGKLHEMSSAIRRMLRKYKAERIIGMSYTLENFRHDVVREALGYMTPNQITEFFPDELIGKIPPKKRLRGLSADEIFGAFPAEERLRGLSPEEIRAYLKKIPLSRIAIRQGEFFC
ncbi:MAG: hypothetical protein BWK80_36900 [Desulfobacteraceae bacterium IS3]|nr:MAG: hypothetical protein BWK80_36900 [Desulfobacteraceae bacterium IS3]